MNKIINGKGDIAVDITEVQRTVRDYAEQLHTDTLEKKLINS